MANIKHPSENSQNEVLPLCGVRLESEYTCYMETQSDKGRCYKWCENDNYCKLTAVCDNFKIGKRNTAICTNCHHTEKMHLKSQTET